MASKDNLSEITEFLLEVGCTSFENGANTKLTSQTIMSFGAALGCDSVRAIPHYSSISITVGMDDRYVTRIALMRPVAPNMAIVFRLRQFLFNSSGKQRSLREAEEALQTIRQTNHFRAPLQLSLLMAFSCAAFSKLFGGDIAAMGITFVASFAGSFLHSIMPKHGFNTYLIIFMVSLVASMLAGLASMTGWSQTPALAMVASVLYLVPGVPLINAIEDITYGYPVVGIARLTDSVARFLSIALGLVIAVQITGITIL